MDTGTKGEKRSLKQYYFVLKTQHPKLGPKSLLSVALHRTNLNSPTTFALQLQRQPPLCKQLQQELHRGILQTLMRVLNLQEVDKLTLSRQEEILDYTSKGYETEPC